MVQSPIVVKDENLAITNPRQLLLEDGIDKILGGKGMILKGFKTEKTRVEEHLRNINFYYQTEEKSSEPKESDQIKMKQPVLRFKPRTDLERIFEEINKNSFRKVDKNIINEQIKTIDKVYQHKPVTDKDEDVFVDYKDATKGDEEYDDFDYLGIKNKNADPLEERKRIQEEKKNELLKSRKKDLNHNAKNFMKELHNKTHFKGVTSLVNFNSPGIFYFIFFVKIFTLLILSYNMIFFLFFLIC